MNFISKATHQRLAMSGNKTANNFFNRLKKVSEEYAAGVYEGAVLDGYTTPNASEAYDKYGERFERDCQTMSNLLNNKM